ISRVVLRAALLRDAGDVEPLRLVRLPLEELQELLLPRLPRLEVDEQLARRREARRDLPLRGEVGEVGLDASQAEGEHDVAPADDLGAVAVLVRDGGDEG